MPLGNQSVEWLNLNSQRRYPLAEDAHGVDSTGAFTIPTDFLVALDIPIHAGLAVTPARFFIRQIGAFAGGYSIVIAYQPESGPAVDVAACAIPIASHTPNATYAVEGVGDFIDVYGKLAVGGFENIQRQPHGLYQFALAATRIDPDCVRPCLRGITSMTVVNADGSAGPRLYGDIALVAESNIQLATAVVGDVATITVSAKNGEGLTRACACAGNSTAPSIKTIDGVPPDANGNINIIGDSCLQVSGVEGGVAVTDACSKPCCGCDELAQITSAMDALAVQVPTLTGYVTRLDAQLAALNTLLTGSNIGQSNCGV